VSHANESIEPKRTATLLRRRQIGGASHREQACEIDDRGKGDHKMF
jgi:hypothetical protein